ncbi:MAG: TetR/AcrR family transcriptional regulator [Kocuria sp.]|nr:TetR/AcrR family transcriptional regulator [Kocuria sp.]
MTVENPTIDPRPLDAAHAPAPSHGTQRGSRREKILDGASELFSEFGYYGASLRDISGRVGISHPGLLHHFGSKGDLLAGVIDRLEAHAQGALDHKDGFCTDGQALQRALVETWDPAAPEIQLMATLDAEAVSEGHPGKFRMARLRRVHEHILTHCFETLATHGALREDVDPSFAARAMLSLILRDAVRERTVRSLQSRHEMDAPQRDLCTLARTFLRD